MTAALSRTGLITRKLGMSAIFNDDGSRIGVTLLQLEVCQVIEQKNTKKHGYNAVQIGVGNPKAKNVSKPLKGKFAKAKLELRQKIVEFKVEENALIEVGVNLTVDHFVSGQFVDVQSVSIGKGFAGGMKRHGFKGLEASHGVSVSHRSIGSTGQRQDPGKVFKGKKMPGHMGARKVTIQNLQVISTDLEKGIIIVKGAVPGHKNSYVIVKDAIKRALPEEAPFPTSKINDMSNKEDSNES